MSGKAAIGKGKGKGKKKEEEEAVKGVAIATGVKWSGERKPTADNQYRRRSWRHSPDVLITSNVTYRCKYLGQVDVLDPKGMRVIREAIDRLKLVAETMRTAGVKIHECDLAISIASVTAVDIVTKNVLQRHPLHQISFCADDRRSQGNYFAYIAKPVPKAKEHVCYVYESAEHQAEEIVTTVGQAFEVAFQRFKDAKKAKEDFRALKAKLQTPEEKEEFAKKLVEIQTQVATMEKESVQHERKRAMQKQSSAIAKWENITQVLQPFSNEPSLDPQTLYLVPRPETQELDSVISRVETQLTELEEGFSRPMTVASENGTEEEPLVSEFVMASVADQVQSMQVESDNLDEPDLPANYQMEEYVKAKTMPKEGTVKQASSEWEKRGP